MRLRIFTLRSSALSFYFSVSSFSKSNSAPTSALVREPLRDVQLALPSFRRPSIFCDLLDISVKKFTLHKLLKKCNIS